MSKKIEIKSLDQRLTDWRKQFNKEIPERVGLAYHIQKIYKSGELDENPTTRKIRVVRSEGKRQVNREIQFYNLEFEGFGELYNLILTRANSPQLTINNHGKNKCTTNRCNHTEN